MKKILTLILAIAAFATGTQKAYAQRTGTLAVTIQSGMNLEAEENIDANNAFFALYMTQQIYGGYSDETSVLAFYSTATD